MMSPLRPLISSCTAPRLSAFACTEMLQPLRILVAPTGLSPEREELGSPELETGLQMWSHHSRVKGEGEEYLPGPAGDVGASSAGAPELTAYSTCSWQSNWTRFHREPPAGSQQTEMRKRTEARHGPLPRQGLEAAVGAARSPPQQRSELLPRAPPLPAAAGAEPRPPGRRGRAGPGAGLGSGSPGFKGGGGAARVALGVRLRAGKSQLGFTGLGGSDLTAAPRRRRRCRRALPSGRGGVPG